MTQQFYNSFLTKGWKNLLTGDLSSVTIKCMLTTSAYTPNIDTHDFVDDVTNEITGTGYTAGGATVGSVTVTQDNTNNGVILDAADTTWSTATFTMRKGVLYIDTGVAATSPLIGYFDNGSDASPVAATFTVQWNAAGIGTNYQP